MGLGRCGPLASVRAGSHLAIGQKEFVNMLPLVCNDAIVLFFMFDLSRKATLYASPCVLKESTHPFVSFSVKEWYRQARSFNKTALPVLIGTKYDVFAKMPREEQEEITKVVRSAFIYFLFGDLTVS